MTTACSDRWRLRAALAREVRDFGHTIRDRPVPARARATDAQGPAKAGRYDPGVPYPALTFALRASVPRKPDYVSISLTSSVT